MFPKTNRLRKKAEFKKIYKYGQRKKGSFFNFYFLDNNLDRNRYGIVIANRTVKKASQRNRLKRIIREALKKTRIKKGVDLIVVVKKEPRIDFKTIVEDFNKVW